MKIVSIGENYEHRSVSFINFRSAVSLLDYDFVIWNPTDLFSEYQTDFPHGTYNGHRNLNDEDSTKIIEDIARRRSEILELVNLGRTVVVLLPPPSKCYYATGEKNYSGTGKNRLTTRIVSEIELSSIIPVKNLSITLAEGKNIDIRGNEPFKSYWSSVKHLHYYSAYLTNPIGTPFLFVKGTSKALGTWIRTAKGAFLILPQFYNQEYFKTIKEYSSACKDFIDSLIELSENLKKDTGNFQLPPWTINVLLPGEDTQRTQIQDKEAEISKALSEVSKMKETLANTERLKLLLSGTGRALEIQVAAILKEIGFEVLDPAEGRDDLILKFNGKIAVAEIKGVVKSAAEKHAAQLEKWVSEYLTANDIKPKGFLIVNAWNEIPLDDRSEPAFPDQMIKYCSNREHCLVTTTQLLCLALHLRSHPEQKEQMINELFSTIGVFQQFTDHKAILNTNNRAQEIIEAKKK